jgi:hypothetical protein
MITTVLGLLGFVAAIALPGWLAVQLLDDGDLLWRAAIGLGVGVLGIPVLAFLVAMVLSTSVTAPLLIGVGTTTAAGLALALVRREGPESSR